MGQEAAQGREVAGVVQQSLALADACYKGAHTGPLDWRIHNLTAIDANAVWQKDPGMDLGILQRGHQEEVLERIEVIADIDTTDQHHNGLVALVLDLSVSVDCTAVPRGLPSNRS